MPRVENLCPLDEVLEPCVGYLGDIWVCIMTGNEGCGAKEDGAVMDLLFRYEEKFKEGLGGGRVTKDDVDGKVGADIVGCSPYK